MGRTVLVLVLCIAALTNAGCGNSAFQVAPVTGKVLCKGQPVTSGTITFTPLGTGSSVETGKPASGAIKPDGTFALSTYGRFDGAIVGQHDVQFVGSEGGEADAPEAEGEENSTRPAPPKRVTAQCTQTSKIVLEVARGTRNEFTIELSEAQ